MFVVVTVASQYLFRLPNPSSDYPEAPTNVRIIDGPFAQNVSLAWDVSTHPETDFILKPVLGFAVQAKRAADSEDMYTTSMEVGPEVYSASIDSLSPGTEYNIRVLSMNQAGATPSDNLTITTTATGMSNYNKSHSQSIGEERF